MRAIVSRFNFYTYSGGALFQKLFEKKHEPDKNDSELSEFYKERIDMIWNWEEVSSFMNDWGVVGFYGEQTEGEKTVQKFIGQLRKIEGLEMIEFLEKSVSFYHQSKEQIISLNSSGLYDEYEELIQELNTKVDFYMPFAQTEKLIEDFLRKNSHEFCVDENGNVHEKDFCGKLQQINKFHGTIAHEYSFLNSKPHGECMNFYHDGRPEALFLFEHGKIIKALRRWNSKGEETKGELYVPSSENFNN